MSPELNEIREILQRTNETLEETAKRSKHNEMMFEKFRKESEQRQKEWEQKRKDNEREHEEWERKQKIEHEEWKEKQKKMDAKLESYGVSVGLNAETFFIEATERGLTLDKMKFEKFAENYVVTDLQDIRGKHLAEIDIILEHKHYILFIEVKYRLDKKHKSQYLEKIQKVKRYRNGLIDGRKILLGFATFGVRPDVREYFTDAGFYVFTQNNEELNIYGDGIHKTIKGL